MGQNIIICGLPGIGKTETSKALSGLLDWNYVDTDEYLEASCSQEYGKQVTCRDIFKIVGDYGFRKLENGILRKLGKSANCVISIGGGTLTSDENRGLIKSLGTLVYLKNDIGVIYKRLIKRNGVPAYLNSENPYEAYQNLAKIREPIYEKNADITILTQEKTPLEIALEISERIIKEEK